MYNGVNSMEMFKKLSAIKTATLDLRERTRNDSLGTHIKQGNLQLVSVQYDSNGLSTVIPQTDWVPVNEAVAMIESYCP